MARKISRTRDKVRPAKPAARRRAVKAARKKGPVGARHRPSRDAAAERTHIIETLVAASAAALALTIDPAWREGVKRNLRVILEHAALVDRFSLPDEIEAAPVFRA